jgi:hypothetical protein
MCHARHHHHREAEDALREDPGVRASDEERESTVTLLREHGATGRLDVDELEQRVGAAYQARTRGDLATLLDDLPRTRSVVGRVRARQRAAHRDLGGQRGRLLLAGMGDGLVGLRARDADRTAPAQAAVSTIG